MPFWQEVNPAGIADKLAVGEPGQLSAKPFRVASESVDTLRQQGSNLCLGKLEIDRSCGQSRRLGPLPHWFQRRPET
jgi:hypothetical protein